jgi:hypothetical protein
MNLASTGSENFIISLETGFLTLNGRFSQAKEDILEPKNSVSKSAAVTVRMNKDVSRWPKDI